jgi:hypothetical protein
MTSIAPRYVVRKAFLGRGLGALLFVRIEGGTFAFFGAGARGAAYMMAAGASRRRLRRRGLSA